METTKRDDFHAIRDRCLNLCSSVECLYTFQSNCYAELNSDSDTDDADDCADDLYHISDFFRFAADRHVLMLRFEGVDRNFPSRLLKIPRSLFACRSLTYLRLEFLSWPTQTLASNVSFPAMKTILFVLVNITSEVLKGLLSACPIIENLSLIRVNIDSLVIRSRTMRRLELDCHQLDLLEVASAPQLRCFKYDGSLSVLRPFLEKAPNLEEVNFRENFENLDVIEAMQLLYRFASTVKILTLESFRGISKYNPDWRCGSDSVFNLEELHWSISRGTPVQYIYNSMCMFFSLLKASPSLEKLWFYCDYHPIASETSKVYELMQEVEGSDFFRKLKMVSEDEKNKVIEDVRSFHRASTAASVSLIKASVKRGIRFGSWGFNCD